MHLVRPRPHTDEPNNYITPFPNTSDKDRTNGHNNPRPRLDLITEKDVTTDKRQMTALWNRFRDARKVHGEDFKEDWDTIGKLKDASTKKHVSLFSWVRFRGFSKQMLEETNSLVQSEQSRRGEHTMEFNELCAKLALNPLKQASRTFIDQGVAKGKYKRTMNPLVPDEFLYTLTSFAKLQLMSRNRSQQLTQGLEPSAELGKRFRQVVAQPLAGLTDGTASIAKEPPQKRSRLAIADAASDPEDHDHDGDNDDNEEPSMRPHLLHQHGQVCLKNGRPAIWLGGPEGACCDACRCTWARGDVRSRFSWCLCFLGQAPFLGSP
jgi:hypothetical protein